jgi:hypothetical protein
MLDEQQRIQQGETGQVYYMGETYNVSATVQCFAFAPPFDQGSTDPDEVVVSEMRLDYLALDQRVTIERTPGRLPCITKCWGTYVMPAMPPTSVRLLVDVPPSRSNSQTYPAEVLAAYKQSGTSIPPALTARPVELNGRPAVQIDISGAK